MNNESERRIRALLSRRQLLRVGAVGCMGLTLPRLMAAESATQARSRVKSCILIFHYGGPSHLDTWDMKPNAPREIRGDFKPIATTVPGLRVCEHLPLTAGIAHHVAVIRSMHHPMRNHNSAAVESLSRLSTRSWASLTTGSETSLWSLPGCSTPSAHDRAPLMGWSSPGWCARRWSTNP